MNLRSRNAPAFANPVLIGAITVLVVLIGIFLAYNANAGLPFVPTRTLHVDIADGSDLVVGNDVLENGFRVGQISSMKAITLPTGAPAAQLTLALSQAHGGIPVDSTATILERSALGLKYVNVNPGRSKQVFGNNGTMPITQTSVPVRLDQIFNGYDPKTRSAIQQNLLGAGDLFAGRGSAINDTLAALPTLLSHLTPVAKYLSDPHTDLTGFLQSLDGFTTTVAPVAQNNVRLFADLATTLDAIASSPKALEQTIARSPSTLAVATKSLVAQEPFLVNLTTLGGNLTPATRELNSALPQINPALEAGTRTLKQTPPLDARLQHVMSALKKLAQFPGTSVALNGLTATVDTLNPTVRYLGPYVTVCNDWNYWWTNLAGDIDEATNFGFAQRALFNQGNPLQPNSISSAGAAAPVNGGGFTAPAGIGGNEYAHGPAYGAAIDNQGNADCETGQRGYPLKLNAGDPQGRNIVTDAHVPGDQGPTFTGRAHVPAGETFSRNPQIGDAAPSYPSNP